MASKKRSFSEWTAGDYYLCADCDSVYHGQQELCEHLAQHSNLKRQARKRICIRNPNDDDALDYQKTPKALIPENYTDPNSQQQTCINKLSGIEQLTESKKMNDHYFTYHQLKLAVNAIMQTRKKSPHSMKTSLDVIHDLNVLKHTAKQLSLPCARSDLFQRIQSNLLGAKFKQPPLKVNSKVIVKRSKCLKPPTGKQEMDEEDDDLERVQKSNEQEEEKKSVAEEEIVEKRETVKFQFDASDLQRYLDANSEIIGRLQTIRKEKSFYGVTQEEIDLSKQFAENTAAIIQYSSFPQRLLI